MSSARPDDPAGHVAHGEPVGALDVRGQRGPLGGQVAFQGVPGLHAVHPLLGPLIHAFGVFVRQHGHDGVGAQAVFQSVFA